MFDIRSSTYIAGKTIRTFLRPGHHKFTSILILSRKKKTSHFRFAELKYSPLRMNVMSSERRVQVTSVLSQTEIKKRHLFFQLSLSSEPCYCHIHIHIINSLKLRVFYFHKPALNPRVSIGFWVTC